MKTCNIYLKIKQNKKQQKTLVNKRKSLTIWSVSGLRSAVSLHKAFSSVLVVDVKKKYALKQNTHM